MEENRKKWSAIVLTCQNKTSAYAFHKELELHQSKGFIDRDTLILTVEDPKTRVGSGGATLNALLVVTEHLSAQAGFLTVDSSVLLNATILIMHTGRDYPFSPCSRAFTSLPAKHNDRTLATLSDSLVTHFDCLLYILSNYICRGSPCGVWVCSTDMMLSVQPKTVIDWSCLSDGIVLLLFECPVEYARHHGVCKLGKEGEIKNIIFRGTDEEIKSCALSNGKVPVVGSPVFFSLKVVEKLLALHSYPPLDACTYYGLDNGAKPIQLALIFDILLSMATDISEEDFVRGERSGAYGKSTKTGVKKLTQEETSRMIGARRILWKNLRGLKAQGVVLEGGGYDYMLPSGSCYRHQILDSAKLIQDSGLPFSHGKRVHVAVAGEGASSGPAIDDSAVVMNSVVEGQVSIGKDSVVSHCHLKGGFTIGTGSVLSGVGPDNLKEHGFILPDDLCLLGYNLQLASMGEKGLKVLVLFGVHDDLEKHVSSDGGTFCNKTWKEFFDRTEITADDLWMHGLPEEKRCLFNARLFPVLYPFGDEDELSASDTLWLAGVKTSKTTTGNMMQRWCSSLRLSLKEILSAISLSREFDWRRSLWFDIGRRQVETALTSGSNTCLLPFFKTCAKEALHRKILQALDHIARTSTSTGIAARTLACIADVLGAMAGEKAGLRSGPAGNVTWRHAFQLLEDKRIEEGVQALAAERTKWIDRPDLLIRAARHYEGAEQILRRHAVMSTQRFVQIQTTEMPPIGYWVIAEGPVRIDFSGGWSDTPPIAYEHGGTVTNVAISLNGKKPIQVKVKRIPELEIILVILAGGHSVRVVCKELADLADYSQPHAPGALIKACFCAVNLITLPSNQSLAEQLKERYGGGFEVHSRADVPYGSGLGTSSILAGVLLGALLRAAGRTADVISLVHSVMVVEQMLTCGGGWQDNVGGLAPGFKCARSKPTLPIEVTYDVLDVPEAVIEELNKCLVFVYTGKTRLAKNLLQDVVRNWYSRQPEIVKVVDDLVMNAENCAKALVEGNLEMFGRCVGNYREQKRLIAPGTEPEAIRKMMDAVAPFVYGQCLAGAGGGGFLCAIAKSPEMADKIKNTLRDSQFSEEVAFYDVSIDNEGLSIRVEKS